MGDYLSPIPRSQQVIDRLRERFDRLRRDTGLAQRRFDAANPLRREQERQETDEYYRRNIENRNKRAPRNVKQQEGGQSKVKTESNGNCSNCEMGRNQPQVVKKAPERKRPNPDSPNLSGASDSLTRKDTLSAGVAGSSSAVRNDASPAKKPCLDNKPAHNQAPSTQAPKADPNGLRLKVEAPPGDSSQSNQMSLVQPSGNGVSDSPAQGGASWNSKEDVMSLLPMESLDNAQLLKMIESGEMNPDALVQHLMKLEDELSQQLGEMPDMAANSPSAQDLNKQGDFKPSTPVNNQDNIAVIKSENSDSYDPMMKGPPNTVATDAMLKSGPLPSIQEFKSSAGHNSLSKSEPQQMNTSQTVRGTFDGQSVKTVSSSGAPNMVAQLNQPTQMQASFSTTSQMNSQVQMPFISQQSNVVPAQQQAFMTSTQQQQQPSQSQQQPQPHSQRQVQQMSWGQVNMQNPHIPNQAQTLSRARMVNPMLNNAMNTSMSSAEQLTQFANNPMRGQSPQPGRLPSMVQTFSQNRANFPPPNQGMVPTGQTGNVMTPGQAGQFTQGRQLRMNSPDILQRLQNPASNPPQYTQEQRNKLLANYTQQQGHPMQSSNPMPFPRRPPPRYDETQRRTSMPFQGAVNTSMQQQQQPQQMGQQGMMSHMTSPMGQNMRAIAPTQGQARMLPNQLNNSIVTGTGTVATHSGMMQGMAQQSQQQVLIQRLSQQQMRRQLENQAMMQHTNMGGGNMQMSARATQQHAATMGNHINMGHPSSNVSMDQYPRLSMTSQWQNQMMQRQRQQQSNSFQGNAMMQQSYPQQPRFPQRNLPGQMLDSSSNMRTLQDMTSQGALSSATNSNPVMMPQQHFVSQQQQQQMQQQPQQQQPQQQQQSSMQQQVPTNPLASIANGSGVSGANASFNTSAQQMRMSMISGSGSQQQSSSNGSEMLDILDNIIKNDGTTRTTSQM
ncbi:uncharacterized protein [Diadema antillarum]|uniref:uncharacterized protein n=1 Tax=Diadema antillarum TaxID=105358 RepID=UPI003A878B84